MASLNDARAGDESRRLVRDRRVTYAGMFPWRFWLGLVMGIAVVIALVSGVILGLALVYDISGFTGLIHGSLSVALWGIGIAIIIGLLLMLTWIFPPDAINFYGVGVDAQHRKVAMHLARDWRKIAPRIFAPISSHKGDIIYPGIWAITRVDGGVALLLTMPDALPSGGTVAYLEKAAEEGSKRLDLPIFEMVFEGIQANQPCLRVLVRDATESTRKVEL